jgi:amino acid transporter
LKNKKIGSKTDMSHTISFVPAVLITINIMLGSGLFLNTTELAQRAGAFGFLAYIVVGLLMLPLVIGMAKLVELYPSGGFYTFGAKELHSLIGFASAWTYFVGKLASTTLMIHTAILLIQAIFPFLMPISPLILDCLLILLFCFLNTLNVRIGSFIQYFFFCAKLIPVVAIISSVICWTHPPMLVASTPLQSMGSTIPLVLYAILGFEAACSLSSKIENARVNAPRAILLAYTTIIGLSSLYQFCAYGLFGSDLLKMKNFLDVFAALASILAPSASLFLQTLFYCTIAFSALGAAYGILYSNLWNLHTLAQHNHTWFKPLFIALNAHHIPAACVYLEGIICCAYIAVSHGAQVPLQQISAFGVVLAYTASACALWCAAKRNAIIVARAVPILALINCCMLSGVCLTYLVRGYSTALLTFFALLALGSLMAFSQSRQKDLLA